MDSNKVFKMYSELQEQGGDNKVDNMMDSLHRATEVEMMQFVAILLNASLEEFARAYIKPQFDGFGKAFDDIQERFRVMDDLEKQDLYHKIENMFKDIFMKNFNSLGPETSELMAVRYAGQFIKELKLGNQDPLNPMKSLYPKNPSLYPEADPAVANSDVESRAQEIEQEMKPKSVHSNIPRYEQPY